MRGGARHLWRAVTSMADAAVDAPARHLWEGRHLCVQATPIRSRAERELLQDEGGACGGAAKNRGPSPGEHGPARGQASEGWPRASCMRKTSPMAPSRGQTCAAVTYGKRCHLCEFCSGGLYIQMASSLETGRIGLPGLRRKSGGRGAKRLTRTYNGGPGALGRLWPYRAGPPTPTQSSAMFSSPAVPPAGLCFVDLIAVFGAR